MAITTNFNVEPYYDDFDDNDNYYRILYKPGFAVQSRELTQTQSLLQDQIKKFGDHIFKTGSLVSGGQIFIQNTVYLNIASTYSGSDVNYSVFDKEYITNTTGTKKAYVLRSYNSDTTSGDPITFIITQLYGSNFTANESIITANTQTGALNYYANVAASNPTGNSKAFSINEGVFYYEGFFVKNQPQTVALSKYDLNPNVIVGFEVAEEIVTSTDDTTLLDPAQSASNFQAPGGDRFKISLTLSTRNPSSTDFSQFIELSQFQDGVQQKTVQAPLYGPIGDELARRTFDESGDYVVKPFEIILSDASNTAFTNVILSPGKAYIRGYESQKIASTILTIPKPRTTESVTGRRITADPGYFIYANNIFGTFPTNQIANVELYAVDAGSLVNIQANTANLNNVKVGTARIKLISFDSSANAQDGNTYIYKTYLTDVNTATIFNTATSNGYNIILGNTSTFTLPSGFSANNGTYVGAKFRIVAGPGTGQFSRTIKTYEGATRNVTVDVPYTTAIGSSSQFVIDFDFGQTESLAMMTGAGTTRSVSSNVHPFSKKVIYTPIEHISTFISESTNEPLLIRIGEENIADNTISSFSYTYRRLYQTVSFTSGVSSPLSIGTGETLLTASATADKQQYYTLIVTSKGTGNYDVGSIVPAHVMSVDPTARTITVTDGGTMVANIYATISATSPTSKTKTFIRANTLLAANGTGVTTSNNAFGNGAIYVSSPDGQTIINANTILVKTPGVDQSLFVSDVHSINAIFDFNGVQINTASYNAGSYSNVTTFYTLVNGQKDSYYDWSAIRLREGYPAPKGPLLVRYNRFISSGTGYFDVDSYTRLGPNNLDYADIPGYTSINGTVYDLSDNLDFRPVRLDATNTVTANNYVFDVEERGAGPKIPEPGTDINFNYAYYLPRVDRVILDKSGVFNVLTGVPSLNPKAPEEPADAMTLYILSYPAYLGFSAQTNIRGFDNRRYTMRDIGALERRIRNLEYYTTLSLMEQSALNKQDLSILDNTGLPRFKNGIVVDSFTDKSIADLNADDFSASIDLVNNLARNTYNIYSTRVFSNNSLADSGVEFNGPLLTLQSTEENFLTQNLASKSVNINPFSVVIYSGTVVLDPGSDVWTSEDRVEAQNIDLTGGDAARQAWERINERFQTTTWGAWQTTWTGVATTTAGRTTTTTTTTQQQRTGILERVVPELLTRSIGDRVVDVSIVQFMRQISVLTTGTNFKPVTPLYAFFDNENIDEYFYRSNLIKFVNNNLNYSTTSSRQDVIAFYDRATNAYMGQAIVALTSSNNAFIVNVTPSSSYGSWSAATSGIYATLAPGFQTSTAPSTNILQTWDHYSGFAQSATVSSIVLDLHAGGASNTADYIGQTIRIIDGKGAGQSATINAYNTVTRTANVSTNWTTVPDTTSSYSIGRMTTTVEGAVAGVFLIPNNVFRVGQKSVRLLDDPIGSIERSSTTGEASFFAQGIVQTKQETTVSVFAPRFERIGLNENRTLVTTTSVTTGGGGGGWRGFGGFWGGFRDPLAQTFIIGDGQYPQGIMLSSVRVCFRTKDAQAPVTLQIRTVVNGYPSREIYPFSEVTLTPDKVKTSTIPSLSDPNKYTEFKFDVPVYLLPGEHSLVLLSNSIGYEAYVGEIGQTNLANSTKISEQPYTGSLFLSQNGSTWTADQTSDMMFALYKKTYSTTSLGYAHFETDLTPLKANNSNALFDVMHVMSTDVVLANTNINYQFIAENTRGATHPYLQFNPNENYDMVDGYGRRSLNLTTGNTTFSLRTTLSTANPDVSPMIDVTRLNLLAIENRINNLQLRAEDFAITNPGSGYTSSSVPVTITGGNGVDAVATANVTGNQVTGITLTAAGSGYSTSPTVIVADPPVTSGNTTATIVYNGEDKKIGGNALTRYLTRRVQLAPGFDSGDLRVYFLAYLPPRGRVYVYAKYLASGDPQTFEDKNWSLLTQIGGGSFVSNNQNDFRELTFAPGVDGVETNNISYVSGNVTYTSFATFAIKVVMTSTDPVDVPKIKELRVIALPDAL